MWDGTTLTKLGIGSAYAINDRGQIAGESGSGYVANLWQAGVPTALSRN